MHLCTLGDQLTDVQRYSAANMSQYWFNNNRTLIVIDQAPLVQARVHSVLLPPTPQRLAAS